MTEHSAPPLSLPPQSRPSLVARFRTTPAFPLFALLLGLGLLALSRLPLWHTDLWGHLAYGRLIGESRSLPATEPLMPLSRGVELVDTAWLSQVIGFLTIQRFGIPGLQLLSAACVAATFGVLAWIGFQRTRHVGWTLLGLTAFLWLDWKQLFNGADHSVIIRPQMAAMLAFAITLAVAVGKPRRWHWFAIPITFAAWANLHGSFLAGLTLLALFAFGRAGDVLRRTDKFGAIPRDWKFWRLVLLLELAAVAVLLNPYGLRIYPEAYLLVKNANLQDLVEWQPLTLRMEQGKAAAGVAFVLLFLYRMTPRRIGTGEVLALVILGGIALWTSRMILWWAPVAAYCVMLHSAAVWKAYCSRSLRAHAPLSLGRGAGGEGSDDARILENSESALAAARFGASDERSGRVSPHPFPLSRGRGGLVGSSIWWTVSGVAIVALCFAFTPFAKFLVTGPRPEFDRAVSSLTPTGAARHLFENPTSGQLFNTYEFGDYLLWTNPGIPVFVAGHAHLVPENVWEDYVSAIRGNGWETIFDRYGVETVVLDRPARQSFIDRLMEEANWKLTYEDRNSAVFRRIRPLK